MGKKKNQGGFLDLDDPDATPPVEEEVNSAEISSATAANQAKPKKKDKKNSKKKTQGFDDDDDDVIDPIKAAQMAEEEEEDEPRVKKPAKSKNKAAAAFALLAGDNDDGGGEEEEDEEEEKPKKKPSNAASLFAALAGSDEPEEQVTKSTKKKKEKKSAAALFDALAQDNDEPTTTTTSTTTTTPLVPLVATIVSVEKHPNADKLRIIQLDDGSGDKVQVVTNCPNVTKGMKTIFAPVGCTTPATRVVVTKSKLRGMDSFGMLCGAEDLGWAKGSVEEGMAIVLPRLFENGAPFPPQAPNVDEVPIKKEKMKKTSVFDALAGEEEGDEDANKAGPSAPPPGKKKNGKEDEEDLDAIFAELGITPASSGSAPPETASGGKKKKKKTAAPEEENVDALLASMGIEPASTSKQEEDQGEDGDKELSAAQKKKLKKKEKEKAAKAAAATGDEAPATETPLPSSAPAETSESSKPKKQSAALKKIQEELERRRKMEEEQRRAVDEANRAAEEEERREAEEERKRHEAKELKKQREKEKKEQLKKEGKLLTGKAKEQAAKMAAMREALLKQAAEKGIALPGVGEEASEGVKKRPMYGKKKPSLSKASASATDVKGVAGEEEEEREEEDEENEEQASVEAFAAPSLEQAPAESWEEVVDDWEAMGTVPGSTEVAPTKTALVPAPIQAPSLSTSGSDSGSSSEDESTSSDYSDSSENENDSSSDDSSSFDSSDDDDSSYTSSSEDEAAAKARRLIEARAVRQARVQKAMAERNEDDLRSPICCILGHVDTGKTKILDNIRRTNVQEGEAGGITQQIGATWVPAEAIMTRTEELRRGREFQCKVPGLLIIDTPGHESFTNLRSRGSGLCDMAVLVIDLMHGLEPQTIESINLLRMRKTPFVIAMNKVDRLYDWKVTDNLPIRESFKRQKKHVMDEFRNRLADVTLQLNEQGLNVALYWENTDPKKYVNIIPTSAITGEGIPDLLQLVVKLTQGFMTERLAYMAETQCTVLEVKQLEGLGMTVDCVLVNGFLREGDQIVLCGLMGPIVTTIRALLTPHPLRELRVKNQYLHHKMIKAAQGVKIVAQNLDQAIAGSELLVVQKGDDIDELKQAVMKDMQSVLKSIDRSGEGVYVQASTLGSLEALLEFLKSDAVKIPVSAIGLGPLHKRDVMKASVMLERKREYAVILAFDVNVTKDAEEMAKNMGVTIFTADIIYHLFDQFTAYLKRIKEERKTEAAAEAVFPVRMKIMPNCIFNKRDPIVLGIEVLEGTARIGTPVCVPSKEGLTLGKIASMEIDHKAVQKAEPGKAVAMKISPSTPEEGQRMYGRHFDHVDELVSLLSRRSIDLLKENFRDEMTRDDWQLVIKLKKLLGVD